MTISDVLNPAAEILRDCGVAEYRREAASLLAFVLKRDDVFIVAHPEYQLTEAESAEYERVIERRSDREPFQYIVGRQEFYGLEFEVGPDVLIPRPETEKLVEEAIIIASKLVRPTVCEIGVGSGCISISILHNVPGASAIGVDISAGALSVARQNAERHNVIDRFDLRKGDVFEHLSDTFDLIVSNPPYVPDPQLEQLQAEVRKFEPEIALSGGAHGLDVISRIIARAHHFLHPGGVLLLEIGFDQSERVSALFDMSRWKTIDLLPDLQGIPRIVRASINH
jgi:release factor glutamine methyltransferase